MTKIFNARLCDRFIEIQIQVQSNLKRKNHRTNQSSNILGGSFSNRDNVTAPNLEDKDNPSLLKDSFFSKADPSTTMSLARVLLDRSNETI